MYNQKLNESNAFSVSADELKSKLDSKAPLMLFDLRNSENFEQRHIPGSACAVCNEESKKNIMPRLPKDVEIVLVGEDENYPKQMSEMMRQMGLNAKYLEGGIASWKWQFNESIDRDISPTELKKLLDSKSDKERIFLLDVREPDEFKQWNIEGSINIPLGKLNDKVSLDKIPKNKRVVTICPHGNRSTIGKYILERYGYSVSSLDGGLKAWSSSFEYAYNKYDINENAKVKLFQFRRIGKGCMSYLLVSDNKEAVSTTKTTEAAVIDPVYPVEDYLKKSSEIGAKITVIIDTHQHADHISAAKELAKRTGALYCQSSYENYEFGAKGDKQIKDGDTIKIDNISIKAIHTPGHTLGSISFLIDDFPSALKTDIYYDNNKENKTYSKLLFTGDTLFVNGIGRPDLRDKAKEFASQLFDTLHNKLLDLNGDNVVVFPAHFDKDIQSTQIISSTLQEIKKRGNEFLNLDRQEFVEKVSSMVMPTPSNYKEIIAINAGIKPVPLANDIYELEIGPNRCSIST